MKKYQILVQLPGVDDPARVKEIMQSTAMLEIRHALTTGQPYTDDQGAHEANGGVLPPNTVLLHGRSIGSTDTSDSGDVFFSSRRRHTSCLSDWSSDMCSSDLSTAPRGDRHGTPW